MTDTPLTVSEPETSPKGGIIILHEAFGVTPHIVDIGRRLSSQGWVSVIPHLFHRTGDPSFPYDVDHSEILPHASQLSTSSILADVDSGIDELDQRGIAPSQMGIIGFCMGGSAAILAAAERPFAAAVTFYGNGVTEGSFGVPPLTELITRVTGGWLGLYGESDELIPAYEVDALEAAALKARSHTELVRYPGAGHGFNCDERSSYHAESATDAWRRTLEFLSDFAQ